MISRNDVVRNTVLAKVSADIEKYGQSVIYVGGYLESLPFHYTVGRGNRGLPELLILASINPEFGQSLLNDLDRIMPEKVGSGSLVSLGGIFPLKVIDADERAKTYTRAASAYHKGSRTYQVQQIILCDKEGKFPPDCAAPYDKQPILWRG